MREFRDRFSLPLTDAQVDDCDFVRPVADSPEMKYLHARRDKLGGHLPARQRQAGPVATPVHVRAGAFDLQADLPPGEARELSVPVSPEGSALLSIDARAELPPLGNGPAERRQAPARRPP